VNGQSYGYTYDAYGNLSGLTRPGEAVSICIDAQKNRIEESPPGGCSLIADQDYFGNVTKLQAQEHEYDQLDMPIHRNPEPVPPDHTYVYTADEERIWFINAGGGPPPGDGKTGLTAWEGLFLRDLDGTLLRQYSKETSTPFVPADAVYTAPFTVSRDSIHRNGQLAVIREPGGVLRHQHLDHLGTPRAISAGNGALVSTHKYSPYGKELAGSSGNARQFTGHERDSHGAGESDNLDYMHARFYSPYVGRFLSVDPIARYRPESSPQLWNRYAYSLDSPMKYVDPDGRTLIPATGTFSEKNLSTLALIATSAQGRDALDAVIASPVPVVFSSADAPESTMKYLMSLSLQGLDPDAVAGNTFPPRTIMGPDGSYYPLIRMETYANVIGRFHQDKTGLTTTAHELGHAVRLLRGATITEEQVRDLNGFARAFGTGVSESASMALQSYYRQRLEKQLTEQFLEIGSSIIRSVAR
jgi:RHS repeat-associated protein